MNYNIEILTTNASELAPIRAAIESINKIQHEFYFHLGSQRNLEQTYLFTRENYKHEEVANWIDKYKFESKGNKQFVILILTGTLNINHFGGHQATKGIAYFTTHGHYQFVVDKLRYIKYYLVRYALSFLAPAISNHETRDCMFDRKSYKPDIMLSLNSGRLCSECKKAITERCNPEIKDAVDSLLKLICNQYPYSLVLKGGGVKGLALVGALMELEKHYSFDCFAGTSAGAIASVLLAAGYTPTELRKTLSETNLGDFIEGGLLNWALNLINKGGAVPGKQFSKWLDLLLKAKIDRMTEIEMKHLPMRAIVYASRRNEGIVRFDSKGDHDDSYAKFAVRCSMSIPGVFTPQRMDGQYVYDGGLGNNFPLKSFIDDNKSHLFIGIYLKGNDRRKTIAGDLLDIVTDSNERSVVEANRDKVVIVDPSPVKTTQFNINSKQKQFLIDAGRLGAFQYLHKYNLDAGISAAEVDALKQEVEKQRRAL
jgi:predicted acylesterase/phospholipase RssA